VRLPKGASKGSEKIIGDETRWFDPGEHGRKKQGSGEGTLSTGENARKYGRWDRRNPVKRESGKARELGQGTRILGSWGTCNPTAYTG